MINPPYIYNAVVLKVHDGDTLDLNVDLGFNTWHISPFRLLGCNARELDMEGGPEAKANLESLLLGQRVLIHSAKLGKSIKPDKYGERYLASIQLIETDVVEMLIHENWLAAWNGKGEKPLPPWPRPTE